MPDDEQWSAEVGYEFNVRSTFEETILSFVRELFEAASLRLWQQEGGEETGQHEEGEDFKALSSQC
jgi:hypothetical protein